MFIFDCDCVVIDDDDDDVDDGDDDEDDDDDDDEFDDDAITGRLYSWPIRTISFTAAIDCVRMESGEGRPQQPPYPG